MIKTLNMFLFLFLVISFVVSKKLKGENQTLFLSCPPGNSLSTHSDEFANLVCCPNDRQAVPYKPSGESLCCLKGVGTEVFKKGCSRGGSILGLRPKTSITQFEGSLTATCPNGWAFTHDYSDNANGLVCCPKGRNGVLYKPSAQILCCKPGVGTRPFAKGCSDRDSYLGARPTIK